MARILVVEDDENLRAIILRCLRDGGHQVDEAANGRLAMAKFMTEPPDLVVTDLIMPEQEGLQTIREMKKTFRGLPVIAMSGGLTHSGLYLDLARKLGVATILPKPFTPAQLQAAVASVLD